MYYFPDYIIKFIVIPFTENKAKSYIVSLIFERIFAIIISNIFGGTEYV